MSSKLENQMSPRSVAIIGAGGLVGSAVIERLFADRRGIETLVAVDVRETPSERRRAGVAYETCDVRDPKLKDLLARHRVEAVVHLASIVTPPKGLKGGPAAEHALAFDVDVNGTRNVLDACEAAGVAHLVLTSSGAAYGFHADNAEWLREEHPLRGNEEFPYARNKRLVEVMLAERRAAGKGPRQLVLRPGTILGAGTTNLITDIFEKRVVMGMQGAATPFIFIWVEDVAAIIAKGVHEGREGIYNLAGDGALPLSEIAARMGRRFVKLPVGLVAGALTVLKRLGLSQYGPEQTGFLRFRSALANDKLKSEFGYAPVLTSREVFELWLESRREGTRGRDAQARAKLDRRMAEERGRASAPAPAPQEAPAATA